MCGILDILNILLVFCGIALIIKPPFLFGSELLLELGEVDRQSSAYLTAALAVTLGTLLQANVYIILRKLRGKINIFVPCESSPFLH